MKYYIYIIAALLLASCQAERKAVKKIMKLHAAHPGTTATACAGLYPPLAYTRDSIVYKPGAPSELVYVYADCDTVTGKQEGKIKIPCPPVRITDTILLYKEKQVVNRAELQKLSLDLSACNTAYSKKLKERDILFWVTSVLVCYTIIRFIFKRWHINIP
ncbi:hypothetical protein BAC3_00960 [uncultured bacterium]|nr:hypothetical protein BAC3_00960 [uncultured bacterium]